MGEEWKIEVVEEDSQPSMGTVILDLLFVIFPLIFYISTGDLTNALLFALLSTLSRAIREVKDLRKDLRKL